MRTPTTVTSYIVSVGSIYIYISLIRYFLEVLL